MQRALIHGWRHGFKSSIYDHIYLYIYIYIYIYIYVVHMSVFVCSRVSFTMNTSHLGIASDTAWLTSCANLVPLAPLKATKTLAIGQLTEDENSTHVMD